MKRIITYVLVVAFVVVIAGCGAGESKKDIFSLVENNYDEIVASCEEKDTDALLAIDGITRVNVVDGYVLVYCNGAGIAPSSQDYGFYYSEDNTPVMVDCTLGIACYVTDDSLQGNGYECVVGGNTFFTENIKGNIYFYSNAY